MNASNLTSLVLAFLIIAVLSVLLSTWAKGFLRSKRAFHACNLGEGENLHGIKTFFADAATTQRFLVVKSGSVTANVAVATNADYPLGVARDSATLAGDPVAVDLLGAVAGTKKVSVLSAVTFGQFLSVDPANPGYAIAQPTANGTYWVFGIAVNLAAAAAAGDIIEFIPIAPRKIVIAGGVQSVTG